MSPCDDGQVAREAALAVAVAGLACGRIGFDDRVIGPAADAGVDAAPALLLVAHAIANTDGNGLTTPPIDTTGATLLVLAECTWSTGTPTPPIDSFANSWQTGLASYGSNQQPSNIKLFYAPAPVTGPDHTFTDVGSDFLSIAVVAFAGPRELDAASGGSGATPLGVTVATSAAGELISSFACSGNSVATAVTIDNDFIEVDEVLDHVASGPEDMSSAYLAAAPTPAVVADWAFTGDAEVSAAIAAFR